MTECAQSNTVVIADNDKHSRTPSTHESVVQKSNCTAKSEMFYTRTSKLRRRVKTKWSHLREKLESELAASLDDIATTDVKNLRKNILNLMKKGGNGSFVETESCDSDCQITNEW